MSAFVVSDETINTIVNQMLPDAACEDRDELGRKLLRLNHEAVDVRYGQRGTYGIDIPDVEFRSRFIMSQLKIYTLKAMHCWLYQCAEGDCDQTDLYKSVQDASNRLATEICQELFEYEASSAWK